MPTNRLADLGCKVAAGEMPPVASLLVLTAWTLGCGLLAVAAYRRSAAR